MRTILPAVLALVLLSGAAAAASDKDDAIKPVLHFIDSMNRNDAAAAARDYAPEASILDEFPPYHWMGGSAYADWGRDFGADAAKHGITEPRIDLGKPRHVDIDGDRAYVVVPATYSFKAHGKAQSEKGSTMAFSLQKLPAGWRITGWAYSRH